MRTAQLLLSLVTLGLLALIIVAQRETYRLTTQRMAREERTVATLEKRLNALEEDDCSQTPMEYGAKVATVDYSHDASGFHEECGVSDKAWRCWLVADVCLPGQEHEHDLVCWYGWLDTASIKDPPR